jgi:hypothetical protein
MRKMRESEWRRRRRRMLRRCCTICIDRTILFLLFYFLFVLVLFLFFFFFFRPSDYRARRRRDGTASRSLTKETDKNKPLLLQKQTINPHHCTLFLTPSFHARPRLSLLLSALAPQHSRPAHTTLLHSLSPAPHTLLHTHISRCSKDSSSRTTGTR